MAIADHMDRPSLLRDKDGDQWLQRRRVTKSTVR